MTETETSEPAGSRRRLRVITLSVVVALGMSLVALGAYLVLRAADSPADPPDPPGTAAPGGGSSQPEVPARPTTPGGVDGGYVAPLVNQVGGSRCAVFPPDNVWHSVIDGPGVPLVPATDPAAVLLAAADGAARATFGDEIGEGLNVVPSDGSEVRPVSVAPNWLAQNNRGIAAASDADSSTPGPLGAPQLTLDVELPSFGELRWSNMSLDPVQDNRLYVIDTEECVASEFIGFNGLVYRSGGGLVAGRSSQFDLRSNNRRASRWWGEGPCPDIAPNPFFDPGCDGSTEKSAAARGGSGLSGVGGLVRFEEIGSAAGIDHAIGVVLPRNVIATDSWVWPATVSDGLGEPGSPEGAPEGSGPIPMGARLRLRQDFALDCGEATCPQAVEVVRALKRHGMIVVDSMGPVESIEQAGVHIVGELSDRWDREDLRRIEFREDGSAAMRLSDFELVDAEDMRALPDAGPQDDGWLQVR